MNAKSMMNTFALTAGVTFLALVVGIATVSCGGGGGDDASPAVSTNTTAGATLVGVFRDAPVSGLHFWSPSHHGYTDAEGKFNYLDGEVIEFDYAGLKLGGAQGKGVITPMDLMSRDADSPLVQAIARTLLQLDEDGDSRGGIQLNDTLAQLLRGKLQAAGIDGIDFDALAAMVDDEEPANDEIVTDILETLYTAVTETAEEGGITTVVTYADAVAHLVNEDIFRKNVSKTPELASDKAKLNVMTVYTPAMKADDTPIEPAIDDSCLVGINQGGVCKVKPLVVTYVDIDPRYGEGAAPDAFAAISRDDGATWKRTNLSRTGDRDVVNVGDPAFPTGFKGESRKPVMNVKGNYVAVAWSDKYCKGGSPAYSLTDPVTEERVYDDLYGVSGNQGFVDYREDSTIEPERIPNPPVVPFSCVWAARGYVDPDTGGIVWSKAERLTSGRRDAYQLFVAAGNNAGFAVNWQEDPAGLRPGSGSGPGDGFSGATVNHKTDVWYSYITWADFATPAAIDPSTDEDVDDNPNDPILLVWGDGDGGGGGVQRIRLERFKVPVRVTDNDVCNADNLASNGHLWCRLDADGQEVDVDADNDGEFDVVGLPEPDETNTVPESRIDLSELGMVNCAAMVWIGDPILGWVCQTQDGRVLDGDTGASRPNLFLQPYTKRDGSVSAWAIMGYEETKGLGSGPTDVDSLLADEGKNILYHSFDLTEPEVIARGGMINMPEYTHDDEPANRVPIVLIDGDVDHPPVYATENARRVRFILQGKKPSLGKDSDGDGVGDTGAGTVLIAIYKQGPEGKGRPSDIFARRMTVRNDDGTVRSGNPYAFKNFVCEQTDAWGQCLKGVQNLSSIEPTETGEPLGTPESDIYYAKLIDWTWSEANLLDESWDTPMTEARAHRGQIRGDFVIMGYAQTKNWAAARNGNDMYDLYVRRSFDGGQTWTTDPKAQTSTEHCKWTGLYDQDPDNNVLSCTDYGPGVSEPPRNVSLLKNHKESVAEPRIVAVPGSILCGGSPCTPEDKQDANMVVVSYGLANNVDEDADGELEQEEQYPTDIFYSRTIDKGTTYPMVEYPSGEGWDWLAKRADVEEGEAQWRLTPDGTKMYATWLAESAADYGGPEHFYGSDIWFRKFDYTAVEVEE